MTNQYPWRTNTTPPIAAEDDSRYETPGGAQQKVNAHVSLTSNIADRAVTQPKIAYGAVGGNQLDPALLQNYGDIAVQGKFQQVDEQLADTGVSTLGDLHMVFQYNYENDPARLKRLKAMGINTVIMARGNAWQNDISKVTAFINRNIEYGIYTIIETDTAKLIGPNYQEELDFLEQVESLPGLIGYYTIDEPVSKSVTIADQVLVYTRTKSITSKNIIISEVPFSSDKLTQFQTYYTASSYDMYIINTYYSDPLLTTEDIVSNVVKAVTNFHRFGFETPKNIVANFPFFSYPAYPFTVTESIIRAHVEGWKAFFTGNYAVFAHDVSVYTTTIDNNDDYQKYLSIISGSLKPNDSSQRGQFLNGVNVAKDATVENLTVSKKFEFRPTLSTEVAKFVPYADNSGAFVYGTNHLDTLILWLMRNNGNFDVTKLAATDPAAINTFAGRTDFALGAKFGGGSTFKKYDVVTATLDFGTVAANSSKDLTITLSGAAVGDSVKVNPFVEPSGMIYYRGFVSAAGVITVRLTNFTAADIVVGSTTWYADVTKR